MISNERPSPYGYGNRQPQQYQQHQQHHQGGYSGYQSGPRPPSNEDTLKSDKIQIERKMFIFTLKENPRGRFLRITEDVNGRRDNIIIPAPGLAEFKRILDEMVAAAEVNPPKAGTEAGAGAGAGPEAEPHP